MQFSSGVFLLLFLPIGMVIYKLGGKHTTYKNIVLLLLSIIFYAWGEPRFVFILLAGILINYFVGLAMERWTEHKKLILILSLIFNLGLLVVFKYLTFIMRNVSHLFNTPVYEIALPVGISFYTFQIMSYVFDVYYGKVEAQHNFFNLALYISMFPQLVAGPIVRYATIEQEIRQREETKEDFAYGINRFIVGLGKKVLLADYLAVLVNRIFTTAEATDIPVLTAWVGAFAFTLELYFDFDGYSDMAIGLGRCFGFHFEENFNYPYTSLSVTEHWRRWHISLTTWFKDYVYIPMGGNRVSEGRHIFNIIFIWLLTGIWHGAEWTYLAWGMMFCGFQLLEKETGFTKKIPKWLAYIYTVLAVTICSTVFKTSNITAAGSYLKDLFTPAAGWYDANSIIFLKAGIVIMVISYIASLPVAPLLKKKFSASKKGQVAWEGFVLIFLLGVMILSAMKIINGSYSPFIYFNF